VGAGHAGRHAWRGFGVSDFKGLSGRVSVALTLAETPPRT
jgi:hypothetical protein